MLPKPLFIVRTLWLCALSSIAPAFADVPEHQGVALKPAWQNACEEIAGGGLSALSREARRFLAEAILRGFPVSDDDARLLLRELEELHARVMGNAETRYRVSRSWNEPGYRGRPIDLILLDVDSAIEALSKSNRVPLMNRRVVHWLAHRLLRPKIVDLNRDDSGRPLVLPKPGDRGELLIQYLRQKFGFNERILSTLASPDGSVFRAVTLEAFPGGPTIAFSPREEVSREMLIDVLDAAFLGRNFFSRNAFAVLAWSSQSLLDLLTLFQKDGWLTLEHDQSGISVFTDPMSGNSVSIPQDMDPESSFSAEARAAIFQGLMSKHPILLSDPNTRHASGIRLHAPAYDPKRLN